jgi:alpha-L-fucosidase 2
LQWALCVTCGSWLALHLWDHLLYTEYSSPEYTSTMKTLLPVYRSMAQFYLDYLFEGPDGHVHTGPTTSPENSFAASTTNGRQGNRKMIQYLALSPAIDMSILRQVSSSSEVSLSLLSSPPHIRLRTLIHLHSNGPNIICPTPALTLRHRRSPLIEKI